MQSECIVQQGHCSAPSLIPLVYAISVIDSVCVNLHSCWSHTHMYLLDQMIYAELQITRIAVVLGCIPSQLEMNYVQFSNTCTTKTGSVCINVGKIAKFILNYGAWLNLIPEL